jgi:hypothetical protein
MLACVNISSYKISILVPAMPFDTDSALVATFMRKFLRLVQSWLFPTNRHLT